MCVDFTDLNKACLLDCYPLLEIDWKLAEADEEKTTFHTGHGVYCYTKMPFGLKNADSTYQRLMDKAFKSQVGRNIEVYIDDLVVKSHTEAEMVRDIEETFRPLRKVNMKLNPKKCSFRLAEGVFLGGKISAAVTDIKKCIKKSDFHWTAEAEQAFQQLKHHLSELPLLVAPRPQEELIMYLPATNGAISAAHPIIVITDQPIKQIMSRPDVAGRLQKWSIMLGEHNITYRPMTSVKGQILADFLIEIPGDASQAAPVAATQEEPWTLFTDGSSCVDGSGAWLILTNPEVVEFTYALRFQFTASNNEVEYEALVAGLRIATQMGVKNVQIHYLLNKLSAAKQKKKADALSKVASTSFAHLTKQVLVEVIENKSIKGKEVTAVIEKEGPTWMTQLVDYLKEGILLEDEKEAKKIRFKA
nr:hypothetical protein [Tanacetum cinerariifolium]